MTQVRVRDQAAMASLMEMGFELADVSFQDTTYTVSIVTSGLQRAELRSAGFDLIPTSNALPATRQRAINYPDFDAPVTGIADRLRARAMSDTLLTIDTIGTSFEGRPLLAVKIGPPSESAARPNVVFIGTMHAREWISPMMTLGLLDYLVDSLAPTPQGSLLLASRDIWILPVTNPDGYQYTHDVERLWRKNRRDNPDGTYGVDLNRNFPGLWGYDNNGSSGDYASETFRGAGPASEPETQALIQFHEQFPPTIAVSYHSFGNHILFPYSHRWGVLAPDYPVFNNLVGSLLAPAILDRNVNSSRPVYTSGPGWLLYAVNGDYTEWLYQEVGTFAFTVELSPGCCEAGLGYAFVFPDDSAQIAQLVSDNMPFALSMIEAAADPNTAIGPAGTLPQTDYFESTWPELRAVGSPASLGGTAVARGLNGQQTISLRSGPLENGVFRERRTGNSSGVQLPGTVDVSHQLRGAVLHYADADDPEVQWTGFGTDDRAYTDNYSWFANVDTLTSPEITTWGYNNLRIAFWTRYNGTISDAGRRGLVEYSVDNGTTWVTADIIVGNSFEWYPVSIPIVQSSPTIRFRFVADNLHWWIDAVQILGDAQGRNIESAAPPLDARVSENPVRSDLVYISWPPSGAMANVKIFTFRGDLVYENAVPGAQSLIDWDLTNRNGARVSNGAYIIVIQLGESIFRKRLFVARP